MPVPCKNPRFVFKGNVRLTFCGNKVVESKKKSTIVLERKFKRKARKGPRGGYYVLVKGRKVYM